MTAATHLYRIAAHAIAPILAIEGVRTVYVRRSVAAGDARFPWSDLDLAVVMDRASGADLLRLSKRWQVARIAFPRLGEGQIFAPNDLTAYADTDPYRASLDKRFGYVVSGERPPIPERVVDERAAARRLAFWFQRYLPDVMRRGRVREQRKIALEMYNALGVLEGRWKEPLATRAETESRARNEGLLASDILESPFAACCGAAERACGLLSMNVPVVSTGVELQGLTIVPERDAARPSATLKWAEVIVTPAALQMLLELHDPFLWIQHGRVLESRGFAPPSRRAWIEATARTARADQVRTPGFMGKSPQAVESKFALAEQALARIEKGEAIEFERQRPTTHLTLDAAVYYRDRYDELAVRADSLYRRAMSLLADRTD